MLYLCIVMCYSVVSDLTKNKKFISSFNKKLKNRPFTFMNGNYGVDGYPQLKVVKDSLVFKVYVTKGYFKYYRQAEYNTATKGDRIHRRLSNRIRCYLGHYLHGQYGKHLGLRYYQVTVSLTWV